VSGSVSPATARLALESMRVVLRVSQQRRNGSELPARWRSAVDELQAALHADDPADTPGFVAETVGGAKGALRSDFELIDVAEAARRFQISPQMVRRRLAKGSLPGRRIGGRWVVEWRLDG
jgi:hypothetical protein